VAEEIGAIGGLIWYSSRLSVANGKNHFNLALALSNRGGVATMKESLKWQ
jgi:hypothetical protein